MIGAGKRRRSRRRRERWTLLRLLVLMRVTMRLMMMLVMMRMMMVAVMRTMLLMLLLLLLDANVAGRARRDCHDSSWKRRYHRSLDPDRMRSSYRATIRQHKALGSPVQRHAGSVPIAGISGGCAFQGSDDVTDPGVVADDGSLTIVRPIGRIGNRRRLVLDRSLRSVRARS